MAEQAPAIQSKRLLVVALILALIVVVLFNLYVGRVRHAGEGDKVELLRFRRDMEAGEIISKKDIRVEEVERGYAKSLGNVVSKKYLYLVVDSVMNQKAQKTDFVKYGHITESSGGGPAELLDEGMVAKTLQLDPQHGLGDLLRVYDRVNILARLSVGRKPLKTYRVIRGVRVLGKGGRGQHPKAVVGGSKISAGPQVRTYRSIVVEVPEKLSLDLSNVLSHRVGSIGLELCRPTKTASSKAVQINPELKSLSELASPRAGGGSY